MVSSMYGGQEDNTTHTTYPNPVVTPTGRKFKPPSFSQADAKKALENSPVYKMATDIMKDKTLAPLFQKWGKHLKSLGVSDPWAFMRNWIIYLLAGSMKADEVKKLLIDTDKNKINFGTNTFLKALVSGKLKSHLKGYKNLWDALKGYLGEITPRGTEGTSEASSVGASELGYICRLYSFKKGMAFSNFVKKNQLTLREQYNLLMAGRKFGDKNKKSLSLEAFYYLMYDMAKMAYEAGEAYRKKKRQASPATAFTSQQPQQQVKFSPDEQKRYEAILKNSREFAFVNQGKLVGTGFVFKDKKDRDRFFLYISQKYPDLYVAISQKRIGKKDLYMLYIVREKVKYKNKTVALNNLALLFITSYMKGQVPRKISLTAGGTGRIPLFVPSVAAAVAVNRASEKILEAKKSGGSVSVSLPPFASGNGIQAAKKALEKEGYKVTILTKKQGNRTHYVLKVSVPAKKRVVSEGNTRRGGSFGASSESTGRSQRRRYAFEGFFPGAPSKKVENILISYAEKNKPVTQDTFPKLTASARKGFEMLYKHINDKEYMHAFLNYWMSLPPTMKGLYMGVLGSLAEKDKRYLVLFLTLGSIGYVGGLEQVMFSSNDGFWEGISMFVNGLMRHYYSSFANAAKREKMYALNISKEMLIWYSKYASDSDKKQLNFSFSIFVEDLPRYPVEAYRAVNFSLLYKLKDFIPSLKQLPPEIDPIRDPSWLKNPQYFDFYAKHGLAISESTVYRDLHERYMYDRGFPPYTSSDIQSSLPSLGFIFLLASKGYKPALHVLKAVLKDYISYNDNLDYIKDSQKYSSNMYKRIDNAKSYEELRKIVLSPIPKKHLILSELEYLPKPPSPLPPSQVTDGMSIAAAYLGFKSPEDFAKKFKIPFSSKLAEK